MTRECCECVKSAAGCGPRAPKRSQSLIVDTFLRMFLVGRASPSSCAWSCGMCTCTCANQTHAHACSTVRRHPHIVNAPATSKKRVFDFSHTSMPWKPIFGRKLLNLVSFCCRNKAMSPAAWHHRFHPPLKSQNNGNEIFAIFTTRIPTVRVKCLCRLRRSYWARTASARST